jgi:hypothetical protein
VTFEKSVSGLSDPVHEKPYDGLPAEFGEQPITDGSCWQVEVLGGVVAFVKQQYSSVVFRVVGTLHTRESSAESGGLEPAAQL